MTTMVVRDLARAVAQYQVSIRPAPGSAAASPAKGMRAMRPTATTWASTTEPATRPSDSTRMPAATRMRNATPSRSVEGSRLNR